MRLKILSLLKIFLVGLLASLVSCGYHLGQGEGILASRYATMSVPYAVGDQNGLFTSTVVKEIVRNGAFEYRYSGAALILNIELIDLSEDNIGFRYDRKKRGKLTKDIIPTETRVTIIVEVSVTEAASRCCVLGPVRLSASVDYDHDYYSSRDGINIFSLGQLSDLEEAYSAVQTPLYQAIAQKIVDYVSQSW